MPTYRDHAVVLRTHKLGEADRIITLLSRGRGKVRAVARGVRRTSSKFGARLEPFSHVDVQLATGHSLDVVAQVESLDAFGGPLSADYPAYTAGQVMLETADRLVVEEGEPALQHYRLLVGALRALGAGTARRAAAADPGAGLLPAARAVRRRLRAVVPRLRALRARGPARRLLPLVRRRRLRTLPTARLGPALDGHPRAARGPARGALGRDPRRRPAGRPRGQRADSAFTTWHLERSLRSMAHVER